MLPDGDPDLDERLGRAAVVELVGPDVTDLGERPLDGADDVRQADLGRGASQPEAALVAALAGDDAGPLQLEQDVEQELPGDVLGGRQRLRLHRPGVLERGELDDGPDGVVGLGRDPHTPILASR